MSKVLEITSKKVVGGHTREAWGIFSSWASGGKMTVKPETKNSEIPPIIHCVRHREGFHDVGDDCYAIPEPRLTPTGESQCESLRKGAFFDQSKVSLIISAPTCGTLQIASLVFQTVLASTLKSQRIIAFPDAQGMSSDPCDNESDPDILPRIVEQEKWPVELSLVKEAWKPL
ncbi:hypothetical protein BDV38DRAFT_279176 [Aspergillus pseudotamarii]|uniref:Uncharacterized protein n=1 Tax=Aspergillus pseudotamarii TaxID=132259 RepID=A0A5N6T504_ASPPS|nr:uncharacterized protein BDV38DRAFT_279176 [Aspergillus pseudotamarii]KAE8141271.1 hypothetical protein BDV38DRAFT_279176 [Aspergillus pseudotamarii]